jgi:hypothetical protein
MSTVKYFTNLLGFYHSVDHALAAASGVRSFATATGARFSAARRARYTGCSRAYQGICSSMNYSPAQALSTLRTAFFCIYFRGLPNPVFPSRIQGEVIRQGNYPWLTEQGSTSEGTPLDTPATSPPPLQKRPAGRRPAAPHSSCIRGIVL